MNSGSGFEYQRDYLDFDLEIREEKHPQGYSVVVHSPGGDAEEEMHFPFDKRQLKHTLGDLEKALLRAGGTSRGLSTEEQTVQDFGRSLFEAVLVGKVGTCYYTSKEQAHHEGKGLRLKLHVRPPNLIVLPWEFLYDPDRDEYLCFSRDTPIVRYTDLHQRISPLTVKPPLRILGMVASPRDLPSLDVEYEKGLMDEAIECLQAEGLVELTWLKGETWRDLNRAMWRGPWHIFHFVGHGDFDLTEEVGHIALTDEDTGRRHLLRSKQLATLLDGHRDLRMVLLNSCEGAKGSEGDPFSGTAATLVRRGIPAVVAMQYEITDKAAIEFSRTFYESLADGLPVDAAVTEARVAVSMDSMLEWGTPVLYMRSPDGRLFDLPAPALERDARCQYRKAVVEAWTDNELSNAEAEWLSTLASELGLSSDSAADIEREVMGDTIQAILQRRLDELYTRARRSHQDQDWQTVVDVFAEIHVEDPAYPDPEGLLASAREALERMRKVAEERKRRVAALYNRGQQHMRAREWQQALERFEGVQQLEEGYQDTNRLLEQVLQELARPPKVTPKVRVPDLRGQEISQASSVLTSTGLKLGTQREAPSDTVSDGHIIDQSLEADTEVEIGSSVSVTVSSGLPTVEVPDLSGQEIWQARNTLANKGLHLGARTDEPPQGKIIKQRPEAGMEVEEGTLVTVWVSSGPRDYWLALALRGLVMVIFGLLIAFFNMVPDAFLYGATAMVYGVLVMTDGILTIIGAPKGAGRRPLLSLESRISLLAGAVTFSLGLVASWLVDIGISPGNIVFVIVGLWAICIGVIRLVRAIWLKLEFKTMRLMLMSDALLILFGMFLLFNLWDPRLLLGVWPLASGISLLVFAFQARDQERSGAIR